MLAIEDVTYIDQAPAFHNPDEILLSSSSVSICVKMPACAVSPAFSEFGTYINSGRDGMDQNLSGVGHRLKSAICKAAEQKRDWSLDRGFTAL